MRARALCLNDDHSVNAQQSTITDRDHYARIVRARVARVSLALLVACVSASAAPQVAAQAPTASVIRDNSFLVEEAYNQERGVVQHISVFSRSVDGSSWDFGFTQEWPAPGQRHQISYTIPVEHHAEQGTARTGLGDVALNYRYQVLGADQIVAFAPRLTVMFPTGSHRRGFGLGGSTLQLNFPFSVTLPANLVAHTNVGGSITPRARDSMNNVARAGEYSFGQSLIWLLRPTVNLMLESRWTTSEEVIGPNRTEQVRELLISPGVRAAIDFASGLQIVPGFAYPIGVGPSSGDRRVLVYLSFEHPFRNLGPTSTARSQSLSENQRVKRMR